MPCIIFPGGETKETLGQHAQENVVPEENSEKNINIRPQEHHENKNSPTLPVPYFPDVASAGPSSRNPSPATPTPASATPTPASATPSQAATPTPACRGLFTAAAGRGVSPLTPTTSSSSKQRSIRGTVLSSYFGYHFDLFEVPSNGVADPNPSDPYVFGPPGSGSISQRYGSGSFYHQAKIRSKKNLDSYPVLLCYFFLTFYL
jgi:hypothetical protein